MENLTREDLCLLSLTLKERTKQLNDITRTGISDGIRIAAEKDYDEAMKVWKKIEKIYDQTK